MAANSRSLACRKLCVRSSKCRGLIRSFRFFRTWMQLSPQPEGIFSVAFCCVDVICISTPGLILILRIRRMMQYWKIIADHLSKAGWSWGCVSAVEPSGHRGGARDYLPIIGTYAKSPETRAPRRFELCFVISWAKRLHPQLLSLRPWLLSPPRRSPTSCK